MITQETSGDGVAGGHFVDRFVDTITNLEAGNTTVDGIAIAIEYAVQYGLFVIPALLVIYAIVRRRPMLLVGNVAFLVALGWYRFGTEDWEQRQNAFLGTWVIPVGDWAEQVTRWVDLNLPVTLGVIEWPFRALLDVIVTGWLLKLSWLTVCLGVFFLGWAIRNIRVGAMSFLGLAICGLLGNDYWLETARTIGFIGVAVLLCAIIGVPIGVLCGRVDAIWRVVRPVLDAMQVVHTFVYMLPFIFFFGIGFVSATMVTMVFALPPLIRLTNLGIRQVPEEVVEAARAYGAPEWRVLADVQIPLARPALMAGLNQTMLLSISMLGIAAIMGAGGLGRLLFQAISNLDIALAGSGGLAFFLVAVVLDRLTQRETGDSGNLLSRIGQAWENRRNPELLLELERERAATAGGTSGTTTTSRGKTNRWGKRTSENGALPPPPKFMRADDTERARVLITAAGALTTLLALVLLPWAHNAGAISAYGRTADLKLEGQSFNGIAASGGSWFGILAFFAIALVLIATVVTLFQPGVGSRWFGPDGATVFAIMALTASLAYLLAAPHDDAVGFTYGIGAIIATVGAAVATAGGIAWMRCAPMTSKRSLRSDVATGKIWAASLALGLVVLAGYSGWSYDTRAEAVITPELQAELDVIEEAARAAEAAGDKARAGALAVDLTVKIAKAQRTGDIVLDGFSAQGAGLGVWTLLGGVLGLVLIMPAAGVFGSDPARLYIWSALVAGLGLGITAIGGAWILSQVRTADAHFVSGVGAVFVLLGGMTLFAMGRGNLMAFERKRQYDEIRSTDKTSTGKTNTGKASSAKASTTV